MIETQGETNICDLCDRAFINSGILSSHVKRHESAREPNIRDSVINVNETCDIRHEFHRNMLVDTSFQTSKMDNETMRLVGTGMH